MLVSQVLSIRISEIKVSEFNLLLDWIYLSSCHVRISRVIVACYSTQRFRKRIPFNNRRSSNKASWHKSSAWLIPWWCQSVSSLVLSLMVRRLWGSLLLLRRILLYRISLSSVLLLFNKSLEERLVESLLSCWLRPLHLLLCCPFFPFKLFFLSLVSLISLRVENIDSVNKIIKRSILVHSWGCSCSSLWGIGSWIISIVLLERLIWLWWELRHRVAIVWRFRNFGHIIEVRVFDLPHHAVKVFSRWKIHKLFHEIVRGLWKILSPLN